MRKILEKNKRIRRIMDQMQSLVHCTAGDTRKKESGRLPMKTRRRYIKAHGRRNIGEDRNYRKDPIEAF